MREEKQTVKDYYDTFGWHKDAAGVYNDTREFVDSRPVLERYYHHVRLRMRGFLRLTGKYFLDAGSGAIVYGDTLDHSAGYRWRVCVDLSAQALSEARSKLKDRGLYVKADLTSQPFRDATFESSACEHVLYHVPKDEQAAVINELHRTLRPGGRCVIVYMWPTSPLTRLAGAVNRVGSGARRVGGLLRRARRRKPAPKGGEAPSPAAESRDTPPLYAYTHDYRWFRRTLQSTWQVDIRCWRSIDRSFAATFVPNNVVGRSLLSVLLRLENTWPHTFARLGRYPMIIIEK